MFVPLSYFCLPWAREYRVPDWVLDFHGGREGLEAWAWLSWLVSFA